MFHERARNLERLSLFLDAVCITLAFISAFAFRIVHDALPLLHRVPSTPWTADKAVRSDYAILILVNLVVWVAYLHRTRVYRDGRAERLDGGLLPAYLKAMLLAVLATGGVGFALKLRISRLFFAYFFVSMLVILLLKQATVSALLRRLRTRGEHLRHALVIGSGRPAAWFATIVGEAEGVGYELTGLLLTRPNDDVDPDHFRVIGSLASLERVLDEQPVDEIFIVGAATEIAEMAPVVQSLIERGRTVSIVSPLTSSDSGVRGRVTNFSGIPMISFGPMPRDSVRLGLKRVLDVTVSSVALILLAPVMALIALLIKLFDPGPVLFHQERLGLGRRPFYLHKFRSMRIDAERLLQDDPELYRQYVEHDYKLPAEIDPRISRLGRFLRRFSLDELPQFWNVLRGDMTLVGPRPIVPSEIEKYEPYGDLFLSVRPGITGSWQVNGRSEVQYPERAFLDLDYAGYHSVTDDLSILLRTVPAVVRRRGAH